MVKFPRRSGETPLAISDIVRAVRIELRVRQGEARSIVECMLREIREAVVRGDRVELRGIGTFKKRVSGARWGMDFKSGRRIRVPPGARIGFKISRKLRARLRAGKNGGES
jgi:integration host factor subunit beta